MSRIVLIELLASSIFIFFFFNDTATTEIYTLSLHDALPISFGKPRTVPLDLGEEPDFILGEFTQHFLRIAVAGRLGAGEELDRKSTRLNSSHGYISYAVFCLKKKKKTKHNAYTVLETPQTSY